MVEMIKTTYECEICYGVNSSVKTVCSTCGTIPKQYSISRKPSRLIQTDTGHMINGFIEVVSAIGVDRTERHRYARVNFRTVPADYYASAE